jgi:hypothetical protein
MAEKKVIELEVKTNAKGVATDIKGVTDATKQATQATQDLGEASKEAGSKSKTLGDIKNVITGMVPGLKAAEGGVTSFSTSLKALLANPVILVITGIVAALKFIYEAFQSNVKIGKEIATVWAGLSAVGTQIVDSVMGMVRAFGYAAEAAFKFITLDFAGASKAMKKANGEASTSFDQLTNAVNGTTFAIVKGLEKQQQANNKAKKEQAVRESEINKLLVQSREILTDETASIKEKKKALEEVTKAEKSSSAEKLRTAKVDLDILEKKAKALGGQAEKKMKQEIRDATIALNEAETENAMTGIKLNKQRKMLLRQETADAKEASDAAKERQKEYLEKQKEQTKAREESLKKIKDAEKEYQNSLLTQQQREIQDTTTKYEELIKLAVKNKQDTSVLEEAKNKTISDINAKFAKLELEEKAKFEAAKKALEAKQIADMKSADDAAWNEEKARMDIRAKYIQDDQTREIQERENSYQKELVDLQNAYDNKLLTDEEYQNAVKLATEKANKEKDDINKKYDDKEKERKQKLQDFILDTTKNSLNLISDITSLFAKKGEKEAKRAFNIQKAVSIAQTTIDTYKGAQAIFASASANPSTILFPAQPFITAGLAIAAGLGNVAKIASQKFEGGGGGGSPAPAGGGGGPTGGAVAPSFNIVGNAQATNPLAGLGSQPIKAYVVSGEVTTAQSLDRQKVYSATFG